MLHLALRSTRASVLSARTNVIRSASSLRTLSTSAIRHSDDHHAAAPSIYGVGAKPGEIPTDESQSTGLDRVQVLGFLEGVDVFDLEPLDSSRIGTLADPIKVFSVVRVLPFAILPSTINSSSFCYAYRTPSGRSDAPAHPLTLMTSSGSA
jgi:cytochrome c oxidase subunit 5b